MIIYNKNAQKGTLYLSFLEVEYLINKYKWPVLELIYSKEYIDQFESIWQSQKDKSSLLEKYLTHFEFTVDLTKEEDTLHILAAEISEGNLCTQNQFKEILKEDLKTILNNMTIISDNLDIASPIEIYKLRLYQCAFKIQQVIQNLAINKSDLERETLIDRFEKSILQDELKKFNLSEDYQDSNYFLLQEQMAYLLKKRI